MRSAHIALNTQAYSYTRKSKQ